MRCCHRIDSGHDPVTNDRADRLANGVGLVGVIRNLEDQKNCILLPVAPVPHASLPSSSRFWWALPLPLRSLLGAVEREYRACQINTFGGGVNEIQRTILATMGLGMPRK